MKITLQDILLFDRLFESSAGCLLDFSTPKLIRFFDEELNIDLDDEVYKEDGGSKARRVRCLMRKSDQETVLRTLNCLWSYKQQTAPAAAKRDQADFDILLERINAADNENASGLRPVLAYSGVDYGALTKEMDAMKLLQPHSRGYRFEAWLKELFAAFRLEPRDAFRNTGEQIDGSFKMEGEIYLMEAKWHQTRTPAADLHVFEGKVRQKASWTRGVFISWMGYTEEGLQAFGHGNSIVCVSGADLYHSLNECIPLPVMLNAKIREASESGRYFVPYKELRKPK